MRVAVGGVLSVFGHDHLIGTHSIGGSAAFAPNLAGPASLEVTIDSNSLAETSDRFSSEDRRKIDSTMRQEVLECAKYLEIIFKSTQVSVINADRGEYEVRIVGDLTLHGITHSTAMEARATLDGKAVQAAGEVSLKQSDYGMKRVWAVGGAVKVKDEIKIAFSIVATQNQS